jgi:NAD(P)-dependent dehydrogenase (short-subunit alcohol dehydrogenase family)
MNRLLGKRALVTGATSGIGLETARELLREGARVAITGHRPDALEAARRELGDVVVIEADAGAIASQQARRSHRSRISCRSQDKAATMARITPGPPRARFARIDASAPTRIARLDENHDGRASGRRRFSDIPRKINEIHRFRPRPEGNATRRKKFRPR